MATKSKKTVSVESVERDVVTVPKKADLPNGHVGTHVEFKAAGYERTGHYYDMPDPTGKHPELGKLTEPRKVTQYHHTVTGRWGKVYDKPSTEELIRAGLFQSTEPDTTKAESAEEGGN